MRERINRLAKGIVDTEFPVLIMPVEKIDEIVKVNAKTKRELYLASENSLNLKGLIYSSNSRVKIPNRAFGGLRNHIIYEVDATYLKSKDVIEGCFFLVTNAGEKELPFCFHVDFEASGKTLGDFSKPEDFAQLAKEDMDTALKLFEYQDFRLAPFMQDMKVRGLYDSLKGHGNRMNVLEEFLVGLKVKEPVNLSVDITQKIYKGLDETIRDSITIQKNTWGYTQLQLQTDSHFIQLSKKMATQADFVEDSLTVEYTIQPQYLHQGNNFGRIFITGANCELIVDISVHQKKKSDDLGDRNLYQTQLLSLCNLWIDYECQTYEKALLLNKMQKAVDLMHTCNIKEDVNLLTLFQIQIYLLSDKKDKALLLLDEHRQHILEERQKERENYCYYQYLRLVSTTGDEEQRRAYIRLLQKYMEEEPGNPFFVKLWLLADDSLQDNPGILYSHLKLCYQQGGKSPFIYLEACRLLVKERELLRGLDSVSVHSLLFGMKHGMISREAALLIAGVSMNVKHFHRLYYILLSGLYEQYEESEILAAICCVLIKGDHRSSLYFPWYEKGVEKNISLTRLYEYFLYSLPETYGKLLPKEILLYFSYEHQLDTGSNAILYENILKYVDREDPVCVSYMREIEKFTVEQLFAARITKPLASIYEEILCRDIIDVPMAKVLPAILKTCKITCLDSGMKYVVVCRPELLTEDAYPLKDGIAYVPLFSDQELMMFQDGYGNRYLNTEYEKSGVLDEKELLDQCFEIYPDHPMLCLNACHDLLKKQELSNEDASFLEHVMEEFRFHPLFQKRLQSKVVAYYRQVISREEEGRGADIGYLICLDKHGLEPQERVAVCETLIVQNYFSEAYEMIREFGAEEIKLKRLAKLCGKMVLQSLFDEDDLLLQLSYQVFDSEFCDSVILDYLCEHFNGSTSQMHQVLVKAISDHVETYDLEERLVAQMIFTGNTKWLDQVFSLYVNRKKTGESIVRAYFTIKSMNYFMGKEEPHDQVFEYLEGAINSSVEKDKVPDLYLLALSKYYSTLPELSGEQIELCQIVTDIILEQGMVFPYLKKLAAYIRIPGEIMDKEMVEYYGKKDKKPYLKVRILPGETEFHAEEMRQVYKGIYIKEKVLFEGEVMEYQVYEEVDKNQVLQSEGSIVCRSDKNLSSKTRYSCLNEMSFAVTVKDEAGLKEKMEQYLLQDQMVKICFSLN